MPMEPLSEEDLPALRFAIARSRVRKRVLLELARASPQYASEIAKGTGVDISNVLAALVGSGRRYAPSLSLVALGLVTEQAPKARIRVFRITRKGLVVAEMLRRLESHAGQAAPAASSS